jgi:hypothetical protein
MLLSHEQNLSLRKSIFSLRAEGHDIRLGSPYNFLMARDNPQCCAAIDQKVRTAGLVTRHPVVTALLALFVMLIGVLISKAAENSIPGTRVRFPMLAFLAAHPFGKPGLGQQVGGANEQWDILALIRKGYRPFGKDA